TVEGQHLHGRTAEDRQDINGDHRDAQAAQDDDRQGHDRHGKRIVERSPDQPLHGRSLSLQAVGSVAAPVVIYLVRLVSEPVGWGTRGWGRAAQVSSTPTPTGRAPAESREPAQPRPRSRLIGIVLILLVVAGGAWYWWHDGAHSTTASPTHRGPATLANAAER